MTWSRLPVRLGLLPKILLIQAAVLGLAALLVPLAVDRLLSSRVDFYEHQVLSGRARAIAEELRLGHDGQLHLPAGRFDRQGDRGEFGFAVIGREGPVLLSSTPYAASLLSPIARADTPRFHELEFQGRHYAATSQPVTVAGQAFWVLLGWDLTLDEVIFDDVVRDFLPTAIGVTMPLLALLLVLNILVIRRFFRPVLRVAEQVRALDPARTDARLPAKGLPPEILPLADAFNAALGKVEHGAQLQKDFTADAAHELRTPLAVLGARLQTLPASKLRAELLTDTERMTRIVSQLLDLARLEHADTQAHDTDLLALCRSLVGDLAPQAIARGQELSLAAPDGLDSLPVAVREQDMWHVLRNLVENAIRHTPPGTSIEVGLTRAGELTVQDDGPGIPAELHDQVFQRFWRARRNDGTGAGLGLAIVRQVAEASGGSVTLLSQPGGGTRFVVRLPLAPAGAPAPAGRTR